DDFMSVPSFDVHGELALSLARRVLEHAARPEVAGVVVPHGTDTMEESVYLIDRLLDTDTPVVLTGAQRGADQPDADGPRNLRDAVRLANSPQARGHGALVVFAGEIHAGREARKVHTTAVRAFGSPGFGPIGHVDGEVVVLRRRPFRAPALPVPERLAAVDLARPPRRQRRAVYPPFAGHGRRGDRGRGHGPRQRQRPGRRGGTRGRGTRRSRRGLLPLRRRPCRACLRAGRRARSRRG